jgi:hypothetical protein
MAPHRSLTHEGKMNNMSGPAILVTTAVLVAFVAIMASTPARREHTGDFLIHYRGEDPLLLPQNREYLQRMRNKYCHNPRFHPDPYEVAAYTLIMIPVPEYVARVVPEPPSFCQK